jgi:hypothetical protein
MQAPQAQPLVINKNTEKTSTLAKEGAQGQDWISRYGQLLKYKEKFGHCNVNGGFPGLGKWVSNRSKAVMTNFFISILHWYLISVVFVV